MSQKQRYDHDYLTQFCEENQIILRKNYRELNITTKTIIVAKCVECDNDMVEKSFRNLVRYKNFKCEECGKITIKLKETNPEKYDDETFLQNKEIKLKECDKMFTQIKRKVKTKYNYDYLIQFCEENGLILNKEYQNEKITRDTIIFAKCIAENCENIFKKSFRLLVEHKIIYCTIHSKIVINQRIKETCLGKYKCENPFQNEEIKRKIKNTNMEKRGVEYPSQSEEVKQKIKETCLDKYKCENPFQNEEIKQK